MEDLIYRAKLISDPHLILEENHRLIEIQQQGFGRWEAITPFNKLFERQVQYHPKRFIGTINHYSHLVAQYSNVPETEIYTVTSVELYNSRRNDPLILLPEGYSGIITPLNGAYCDKYGQQLGFPWPDCFSSIGDLLHEKGHTLDPMSDDPQYNQAILKNAIIKKISDIYVMGGSCDLKFYTSLMTSPYISYLLSKSAVPIYKLLTDPFSETDSQLLFTGEVNAHMCQQRELTQILEYLELYDTQQGQQILRLMLENSAAALKTYIDFINRIKGTAVSDYMNSSNIFWQL